MLVVHSMGSHGGQQNFPFGYIPNELHGIGLPDFMTPGPPAGQPLLSEHDTQNLHSFFNGFETGGGDQHKDGTGQVLQNSHAHAHEWMMPPTLVGSETSLRPRNGADWQNFQMTDFTFGNDMNLNQMNQSPGFHPGMHGHGFAGNGHYDHNLLNQLHDAAQTVQPSFANNWPQQNFQQQHLPQVQQPSRPLMRFGSDSHFQPTGYEPPPGQFDPQVTPNLNWIETHSSAPSTQPNTQPNTEPSSPNWPKKRKLEDYQPVDGRRNGFTSPTNGYSNHSLPNLSVAAMQQNKRTYTDQPPPSATLSTSRMSFLADNEEAVDDEDADYDEEDGPDSRTRSISPSSSSRVKVNKMSAKSGRARKKSTASNAGNKTKSKSSRSSTGPAASSSRTPLTADQKKANHTNSEQRRRDATAKAYAELYDLVPELDEMGKQSTMKKLEVVVNKVQRVRDRVRELRAMLGFDVETGAPLQHGADQSHITAGQARLLGGSLPTDMSSWQ